MDFTVNDKERKRQMDISRRGFMGAGAALFAAAGCRSIGGDASKEKIAGFDQTETGELAAAPYVPYSDRKVRVGIAGEGFASFGSGFAYQEHPNVEVVSCSELKPDRLKLLQERVKAPKAYPSCEEMIRHAAEDKLDAVYVATDARSHIQLAIMALEHGLHVVSAVPAFFGKDQLEYVPKLVDAVKRSGRLYMMNETSAFRPECYAMRKMYEDGLFGAISYCEGEYFHWFGQPDKDKGKAHDFFSYKGWRWGLPPQYYPTHSNSYYTCVTHKRFTEVTCTGIASLCFPYTREGQNEFGNPFGSEYAMFKCEDGSCARMLVAFDHPSYYAEMGRIWGQKGCYVPEKEGYRGLFKDQVTANPSRYLKPRLAPCIKHFGGHGASHAYLTDDFIRGILVKDHKVCVDVVTALNTTIAGVYAHLSAMKGGEALKVPAVV